MREKLFYISVSSNFGLWPPDVKFDPLVIFVQRYISIFY